MIFSPEQLDVIKNVDICTVDPNTLADISTVKVDGSKPKVERLIDYMVQIKNPYCFKVGNTVVKISFAKTEVSLEDCLERYLRAVRF